MEHYTFSKITFETEANMTKLTIIVGMAGSGKSWLCDDIDKQSTSPVSIFKDATLTYNDERRAGHNCLGEMVARLVGRSEDCVMDEAHLTVPDFRQSFKRFCDEFLPDVEQRWNFFDSNTLACINNLYHDAETKGRDQLSRYEALDSQRVIYEVPTNRSEWPGFTSHKVHQCGSQFENEAEAINWLQEKIKGLGGEV
jgi:hypothetical protein